jgi:homoserine O-acetyltransferase/O-succinyltransferase
MTSPAFRHPPLRPGYLDAPHQVAELGDHALENGEVLRSLHLSYVTHGVLSPQRDNAVLVTCAIGSTHHRLDFLIGPGRALDPNRFFVVAVDALGNGLSSSPSNSLEQPGPAFPRFSIRDLVATQARLLAETLDVPSLRAVVGASMGGMQALQWAVQPLLPLRAAVALTPMARTTAWSQLLNEVCRRALHSDPTFKGGHYREQPWAGWRSWALVHRGLAMCTPASVEALAPTAIELERFIDRLEREALDSELDANDWIAQSHAYDAHDVGGTPGFFGDTAAALASVSLPVLVMAPPLDLYNPAEEARRAASLIPGARWVEIPSAEGHLAAGGVREREVRFLDRTIAAFLSDIGGAGGQP